MIPAWLIQLVSAYFGALGFAFLFNVQKARLFWAGFGGMLGWGAYLLCKLVTESDVIGFFVAGMCFTLYAEPMARLKKTPSTVFLVPAAIPLVPGASLFRSMRFAVYGMWDAFSFQILYTLLLAAGIAGGVVCGMTAFHIIKKLIDLRRAANHG